MIRSSATRPPDLIVFSTLMPGGEVSVGCQCAGVAQRQQRTERRACLDIVPKEVARADGLELREALQEALRLCSLADTGRTDEDDTGGSPKSHSMLQVDSKGSRVCWLCGGRDARGIGRKESRSKGRVENPQNAARETAKLAGRLVRSGAGRKLYGTGGSLVAKGGTLGPRSAREKWRGGRPRKGLEHRDDAIGRQI
jgi:hypothetical protein